MDVRPLSSLLTVCALAACSTDHTALDAAAASDARAPVPDAPVATDVVAVPHDASPDAPNTTDGLTVSDDGTFSLRTNGAAVFSGATVDALVSYAGVARVLVRPSRCTSSIVSRDGLPAEVNSDALDALPHRVIDCPDGDTLGFTLYLQDGTPGRLVARAKLTAKRDLAVLRSAPFSLTPASNGSFATGRLDVATDRVIDNGSLTIADQSVRLYAGDQSRDALTGALPVPVRGNIVANNDLAVGNGRYPFLAGFLTAERGLTSIGLVADPGGHAYGTLVGETTYLPAGKSLHAGDVLWTEVFELRFDTTDPFGALEGYARDLAATLPRHGWQDRGDGRHVPSAWQSWTLGFDGGYGHDVTSAIIRDNVLAAERELAPYGFDIVPVDDGWQVAWGDWTPNSAFADGWSAEVDFARAHGLGSGFWIAPFTLDASSATARAHPDWLATVNGTLGALVVPTNRRVLDLSRDDVLAQVRANARAMNAAGLRWYKQDYTYQALATVPGDAGITSIEAFRRGWSVVRDETPDRTFLLAVGIYGPNYGVADAVRTGLDTGGRWDERPSDPDNAVAGTRAMKANMRTASRRYYLNDHVIVLDPDALPFRPQDDPPTIGDLEERTYTRFAGLLGGVVEVGDPIVGLRASALDSVRQILPVYGRSARPLDLFVRDYNERFRLAVTPVTTGAGAQAPWVLLAVTNWGRNRDWSHTPASAMGDVARTYRFTADEALGAGVRSVAWAMDTGTLVAPAGDGSLSVTVAPHDSALVVVRPEDASARITFLGTDRHFTGGATDVRTVSLDPAGTTITVTLDLAAAGAGGHTGRERVAFHVPGSTGTRFDPSRDLVLDGTTVTDLTATLADDVLTVSFVPTAVARARIAVTVH